MYVIYIILMYFNKSIEPFMEGLLKKIKNRKHAHKHRHEDHNSNQTEAAKPLYYENPKSSANGTTPSSPKADDETTFSVKNEEEECSSSEEKSSEGDEKEYHPAEGHKDCKFPQYRITNACFFFFYFVFFRYESLVLFLMYILYIVVMYFNKRLEQFFYQYLHTLSGGRIGDHSRTLPEQNERQALLESEKVDRSGSVDHNTIPKEIESSFNSQGNRSLEKSTGHKECKTLERFWFHSSARTPPPPPKNSCALAPNKQIAHSI